MVNPRAWFAEAVVEVAETPSKKGALPKGF